MIALRRRTATRAALPPLPTLDVRATADVDLLARLTNRSEGELQRRFADGHRAYVAWYDGVAAAYGWVATRVADIGELQTRFAIPVGERYLWNFVTRPSHRGLGIYPRLIDAIVNAESDADRFWIAYAPENHASGSGISKAGFTPVAALSFDAHREPAVRALDDAAGGDAARLLGLPLAPRDLAPCWKCVRAGRGDMACAEGACHCDYQRPNVHCAA